VLPLPFFKRTPGTRQPYLNRSHNQPGYPFSSFFQNIATPRQDASRRVLPIPRPIHQHITCGLTCSILPPSQYSFIYVRLTMSDTAGVPLDNGLQVVYLRQIENVCIDHAPFVAIDSSTRTDCYYFPRPSTPSIPVILSERRTTSEIFVELPKPMKT
jgi:hypothetical protein